MIFNNITTVFVNYILKLKVTKYIFLNTQYFCEQGQVHHTRFGTVYSSSLRLYIVVEKTYKC